MEIRIPVSSTSPKLLFNTVPKDFIDEDRFIYAAISGGIAVSSDFRF